MHTTLMHTWGDWFLVSAGLVAILTRNLKGRKNAAALWVVLWLIAAFSAVNTWDAYQNLLSLHPIDFGLHYSDWLHQNTNVFRGCLVMTIAALILPIVIGRKQATALWVVLWLIAAFSAVNTWHAYQNLLSMRLIDFGLLYPNLLRQSTDVFHRCLIATVVILILPVVNYRWVARKEGKENIPKESVSFTR